MNTLSRSLHGKSPPKSESNLTGHNNEENGKSKDQTQIKDNLQTGSTWLNDTFKISSTSLQHGR
jgi:hypothetical protein